MLFFTGIWYLDDVTDIKGDKNDIKIRLWCEHILFQNVHRH